MPIHTKSRRDLKSYFVRNAIPTERNFAELIEGQLNQADDGIFKVGDDPLSIVATRSEQRPVLRFYAEGSDAPPDWSLSLNPRGRPADPASARPGLGIVDGGGQARLFVDRQTGRIGIGTTEPQGQLDVRVPDAHADANRLVIGATSAWGDADVKHATVQGGSNGLLISNPGVPWDGARKSASIRYGRANGVAGETWWDAGVRADGSFSLVPYDKESDGKEKLRIGRKGEVTVSGQLIVGGIKVDGLRIDAPEGRLHITGGETLHVLNKSGLVISKEWGGEGSLTVQGNATFQGNTTLNGPLSIKEIKLAKDNKIDSPEGRMHISGSEFLYVLNKSGMIIGKEWGGTGSLWVQGNVAVGGVISMGVWTIEASGNRLYFKRDGQIISQM